MREGAHHKTNRNWQNHVRADASSYSTETAMLAVLMDIREELRGLNATLDCRNFRDIPTQLRGLRRDLRALQTRPA